jgi:hypothetical protein
MIDRRAPLVVYLVDDRNAGEQHQQGRATLRFISTWEALDLLAVGAADPTDPPANHTPQARDEPALPSPAPTHLATNAAVADHLGTSESQLYALMAVLPPEAAGAATVVSRPGALRKRRRWVVAKLEAWLDAVQRRQEATAKADPEGEGRRSSRRRRPARPTPAGDPDAASDPLAEATARIQARLRGR